MDLLTERNSVHKHYNGFIYRFDRMISDGRASLRCPQKGCKGRVHVNNEVDNFLLYDSGVEDADRFLIFGTQKNFDILADYSNWFADGTFKIAPHLFYQLHTLHALHEHSVLPMLYIYLCRVNESKIT